MAHWKGNSNEPRDKTFYRNYNMKKLKNQWRPRIINIMADGSQVDDLTGYTIPKDSGYYNAIRRINKEI